MDINRIMKKLELDEPIPESKEELEAEIKKYKDIKDSIYLAPIEYQLIDDRIKADKKAIIQLKNKDAFITPVIIVPKKNPEKNFKIRNGSMDLF